MPFTPSHAAAAIPFFRTRLVPSALVIGCMAPDFEYFMRLEAHGGVGHRFVGVFVFDLPVSLFALWLFHTCAKEPLYTWLPRSMRQKIRLGPAAMPIHNFREFSLVVLSVLIGVATHIFWDSFTHRNFWPYRNWEFLHRTVQLPFYGQMEYLRVNQHVSTLAGALALLLWYRGWHRSTAPVHADSQLYLPKNKRSALAAICVIATIAALLRALAGHGIPTTPNRMKHFAIEAIITVIAMFWLQVVLYGFVRARTQSQLQNV